MKKIFCLGFPENPIEGPDLRKGPKKFGEDTKARSPVGVGRIISAQQWLHLWARYARRVAAPPHPPEEEGGADGPEKRPGRKGKEVDVEIWATRYGTKLRESSQQAHFSCLLLVFYRGKFIFLGK